LHTLWKIERPEVTKTVSAAAANGDRSENGDYIYGKKRLREIDARVRFLRKRLDVLQVVAEPLGDPNRVWFGAWVTVEDEGRCASRVAHRRARRIRRQPTQHLL
jgi:transcription elongation factor GreB